VDDCEDLEVLEADGASVSIGLRTPIWPLYALLQQLEGAAPDGPPEAAVLPAYELYELLPWDCADVLDDRHWLMVGARLLAGQDGHGCIIGWHRGIVVGQQFVRRSRRRGRLARSHAGCFPHIRV